MFYSSLSPYHIHTDGLSYKASILLDNENVNKKMLLVAFLSGKCYTSIMFNWNIISFKTVESTNDTARHYPCGTAIIAERQTRGRGRHGRVWQSLEGNLFLSVVLSDWGAKTPLLAFVFGLAVIDALPEIPLRLKWPNDVLWDGAKVAGILLERIDNRVIAGIGVNLNQAPINHVLYPTKALGGFLTPPELANRILACLNTLLTHVQNNGTAWLLAQWTSKASGLGQSITVKLPTETITGIFKTLSPDGALVLSLPNGTEKNISAGDIFL